MSTSDFGKVLIAVGMLALIIGLLLLFRPQLPSLGRLPGDFSFRHGNTRIFFPVTTSIVLSMLLTIVVNIVLRLFK